MSSLLNESLWDEWSAYPHQSQALSTAECAGILTALPGKGVPFLVKNARLWVLRRLLKIWKRTDWRDRWNVASFLSVSSGKKRRVQLALPQSLKETADSYADEEFLSSPLTPLHWAWIRGVWGCCGGLYAPKSGYYLVIRLSSEKTSPPLKRLLSRSRISWGSRIFRGSEELILRDQQNIVTFLCRLGLNAASLRMEEKAIVRSIRDNANRARNCDTANIKRVLRAAREQTRLARKIQDASLLEELPFSMRELVRARLENPDASLSELGAVLSPPVTKSTVKYRWQRLSSYVDLKL